MVANRPKQKSEQRKYDGTNNAYIFLRRYIDVKNDFSRFFILKEKRVKVFFRRLQPFFFIIVTFLTFFILVLKVF